MLRKLLTKTTKLPRYFSENVGAVSNVIENISQTVKGIQHINHVEEFDPTLTAEQKLGLKQFLIYRTNPSNPDDQPHFMSYWCDLKSFPPMYLDALLHIKNKMDPTLSLRRSCREGICGSCSMNLNGFHGLACIQGVEPDLNTPALVSPLGHMFVLKDLVVDMTNFYTQYKMIEPYLKRKTPKEGDAEYYQSQEDRAKLDGLYECVLCACCSTSCPSYWWHPDRYLGPAVLMQAYRWIIDSRDEYTDERLENIAKDLRLDDCQNVGMCSVTCPKGLNPQGALQELLKMIGELKQKKMANEEL